MSWRFLVLLSSWAFVLIVLPTQLDAFVARSTGCLHNGTWYGDKSMVPTTAKCLSCLCNKKTLVCRLKVCPEMPMPPPRGCVVVQKKNTCCPYLSCARLDAFYRIPTANRIIAYLDYYERESIDRVVNENVLQRRSDDSDVDLYVCVKNGTVYKSGSAMSSSNLCTYCYCIGGTEKCVKPKCMLPVEGCKPIFVDSTCCPVRYDCSIKASGKSSQEVRYRKTSNKHFLRMSQRLQRNRGCTIGSQFYVEGQKMKSDPDKPCDICFCIRGMRRCAPKKCAPALKNCMPVVPKGQCCPSSYDCGSQRDYRRAQNSRQFNLFSLLFGGEDSEIMNSTDLAVEYPHDRHPRPEPQQKVTSSTTEKSIFDTLREGLEFIDQNNQLLETELDVVNYPSTTQRPFEESGTAEESFLDLLLGPSNRNETETYGETLTEEQEAAEEKTTPGYGGFSWVDLLLGPDEDETSTLNAFSAITDDNVESTTYEAQTELIQNIDRIDDDFDDFSGSGQIHVGELWGEEQTTVEIPMHSEETTTERSTTAESSTTTERSTTTKRTTTTTSRKPAIVKKTTERVVFKEKPAERKTTQVPTTTSSKPTQKTVTVTTKKSNLKQVTSKKPSPVSHQGVNTNLAVAETKEKLQEKTDETAAIKFEEPANISANQTASSKPSGFLTAFIDGITGMLNAESRPNNKTQVIMKQNLTLNQLQSKTKPTVSSSKFSTTTKAPPVFKPLPTHKQHTRINSKIANLTLDPAFATTRPTKSSSAIPSRTTSSSTTTTPSTTTKKSTTPTIPSTHPPKTTSTTKPTTTTTTTTTTIAPEKPVYIKTNPTILDTEPLDANSSPTLPPSLPNLKIIPFLPTDAVQADHNKLLYDYYHGIPQKAIPASSTTLVPPLIIDGRWDTVPLLQNENSKIDYDSYDEGKIYPSITEQYQTYPDFEEGSKAEYIYKFNVEGPSSSVTSSAGKMDGKAASAAFVKFDFGGLGPQTNGFSPPTKTEGGFVPKDENGPESPELYQVTPHIIDITTAEPTKESTTRLIEITTPDPFKDVIKTEPPPDLFSLIEDKQKILLAQQKYESATTSAPPISPALKDDIIVHITTELPELKSPLSAAAKPIKLDDILLEDKKDIDSLLDLLFQEDELDTHAASSTTVPPFKQLPKKTILDSTPAAPIKGNNTKMPLSNKEVETTTESSSTKAVRVKSKPKVTTMKPRITTRATQQSRTTKTPSTSGSKSTTNAPTTISTTMSTTTTSATPRPTTTASTTIITTTTKSTTTRKPLLMAPFDKLPFMDASFEVRRNTASVTPHKPSDSFLGLVHYKNSLNKIEGLEPAFESFHTTSTSTTTAQSIAPTVSTSSSHHQASNNLIDPSGILKLAGCNIYGRMYRVGRIILELSSPCLECKCTEVGVKCGPLDC